MLHCMKLNRDPFEKIKSGSKTIEMRLFDEKLPKDNYRRFYRVFICR